MNNITNKNYNTAGERKQGILANIFLKDDTKAESTEFFSQTIIEPNKKSGQCVIFEPNNAVVTFYTTSTNEPIYYRITDIETKQVKISNFYEYKLIQNQDQEPKIEYRNEKEVMEFLASSPEVLSFVKKCWVDIKEIFGNSAIIILEVMKYHENEKEYVDLIGWIQSEDQIETGLDKYDQFTAKWLDEQLYIFDGKFNFNIEFINEF